MRTVLRTLIVTVLAVGLVAVFLRNADYGHVWMAMKSARIDFLVWSLVLNAVSFVIRVERWQYLLAPLGPTRFRNLWRTTIIGFAASAVLPARAGEVLRPYLLARQEGLSATATFATIIVERVLDLASVLLLLACYLLWFDPGMEMRDSTVFRAIRFGGLMMAPVALGSLVLMFFMAGHPDKLHEWLLKAERVLPAKAAAFIARLAQTLAEGFAAVRNPVRFVAAVGWSVVLWVVIAASTWAVARAFYIEMPFTGGWLMSAPLVVGVAVPTPGGVGGFHEAFRIGATSFFGAQNDTAVAAAIVLHAVSIVPVVLLGLLYTVQDGLKLGSMRDLTTRGDAK